MAVAGRVLHLGRLLEAQADECLKALELSYTELDLLATLRRSGAPYRLSPTDLRRSVLLTSGAMTACLNRLQRRGLLRREADPGEWPLAAGGADAARPATGGARHRAAL